MKNETDAALPAWCPRSGPALIGLLLLSATLSTGASSTCNPCGGDNPYQDPVTGECTPSPSIGGTILGPVLPGSGNLPSEPGTPTPTTQPDPTLDPDWVDVNVFGLGGRWLDSGREICIQEFPQGVAATYYVPFECNHGDATGLVDQTTTDFVAQLSGKILSGNTNVCTHGNTDPTMNGLNGAPLTLVISADGKKLIGNWQNTATNAKVSITLTRQTVGNCTAP